MDGSSPIKKTINQSSKNTVIESPPPAETEQGVDDATQEYIQQLECELELTRLKLQATEKRLDWAMEAAQMGCFAWEPITDHAVYDSKFLELFDLPLDCQPVGQEAFQKIHQDDVERVRAATAEAIANGSLYEEQFRVVAKNGETRWLAGRGLTMHDPCSNQKRLIGMNWDITEHRQESESRRRSEGYLQRVIDGATVGIAFARVNGDVVEANDPILHLLGLTREQFESHGFNWKNAVRSSDRKIADKAIAELKIDGRMEPFRICVDRNGKQSPVMLSATALDDAKEEFVVFMVDLTEQERFENSLREARRLAERANQTKSEFLANMSHEIRTPVAAIVGYLDILTKNLSNPADLKCVSIIRHNSRFLLEIINDILDISKIEAGKLALHKKRFRPDNLVADVRSLMDVRAAEKDIDLKIEFADAIPKTIRNDDKRLKQILVNLIGNAIKFTNDGSVTMNVSQVAGEEFLQFDVIDTGIGIEPQKFDHLFKPFFQGDTSVSREYGGTGLGLAISQRLAKLMGGQITASSKVGIGSIFSLRVATGSLNNISMVKPNLNQLPDRHRESKAIKTPQLSGRFLVVDDREDIRFIAQEYLQAAGGDVDTAINGREAVDMYVDSQAAGIGYDMILLDMQMPVMDGYQAAAILREIGCEIPIIAVTAHAMTGDRQRCIAAGCSNYLTKPLNRHEFLAMVSGHLTRTAMRNNPSSRRVLVVDDSIDVCDALQMLLEAEDHTVEKAFDGLTTLSKIKSFNPDLVLLDLSLPEMSGFDVMRKAKDTGIAEGVVFVALTGQDNAQEALAAGFDHHMLKPVDVEELERFVSRLG